MRQFEVKCPICDGIFYTNRIDKFICSKACLSRLQYWKSEHKLKHDKRTALLVEEQQRVDAFLKVKRPKPQQPSKASQRPDYLKWKARKAVELALRYGKITKPEQCPLCLRTVKIEAHHHDYSQPLLIEWTCRKCHLQYHSGHFSKSPTALPEAILARGRHTITAEA